MDKTRQYLSNPLVVFIVCLVIGLISWDLCHRLLVMAGTVDQFCSI